MDRMGRDLVEIREAMEWAMKEMTRLKDHVDYQLDLRAPFAFMFNRITQDPTTEPPVANPEAPFFVQEGAEYEELTGKDPTWGQLHCIREEEGEPAPPPTEPRGPTAGWARGDGGPRGPGPRRGGQWSFWNRYSC